MRFRKWLKNESSLMQPDKLDKALRTHTNMRRKKRDHSKQVQDIVGSVGASPETQLAAALHDVPERGGNIMKVAKKFGVPDRSINVVHHLTDPEKFQSQTDNAPLDHIKHIIANPNIPPEEKRSAILIKIADRLSNLHARIQEGKVSKGYAKKSSELLQYLFGTYASMFGINEKIQRMYDNYQYFNNQIVALHKKRDLGVMPPFDKRSEYAPNAG
jgi:(p)ppGpp synthase/HD superfamily hydrolase